VGNPIVHGSIHANPTRQRHRLELDRSHAHDGGPRLTPLLQERGDRLPLPSLLPIFGQPTPARTDVALAVVAR
jgi:hypothetical protein